MQHAPCQTATHRQGISSYPDARNTAALALHSGVSQGVVSLGLFAGQSRASSWGPTHSSFCALACWTGYRAFATIT